MIELLSQVDPSTFWNAPNDSSALKIRIIFAAILGFALLFGLMSAPPRLRRPVIVTVTFVSGLFYVLLWLYPAPISRDPAEGPRNTAEAVSFWLDSAQPVVANFTNILSSFLLGLGIYSLLRIHLKKVVKQQKDWPFSLVLLVSLASMALFGYLDWFQRQNPPGTRLSYIEGPGWGFLQYGRDLLFDGLLQQMDAAMFSLIAFYILSAAYRAFRARSVEATVLLIAALVMMLSLMGLLEFMWNTRITAINPDPNGFIHNFDLTVIAKWVKDNLQTPSIRGLDFGVGIGLLAMALRIWLSKEPMGGEA